MSSYNRALRPEIEKHLARGKSILLLGARQTGKTTLLSTFEFDIAFNLMDSALRRRYESRPETLGQELRVAYEKKNKPLRVFIDEIQKVPELLDNIQILIDEKIAQFVLTGSSARKLRSAEINWLPGRVVKLQLDPLLISEIPSSELNLEKLLIYGQLPGIISEPDEANKEIDLKSYVEIYLEEEIRMEALVRNVGEFSRFLELAAAESGYLINMSKLSSDVGINQMTLRNFFQILEDCLIAKRIEPITETKTRRRLLQSNKFIIFDLGVRRIAAQEGPRLSFKSMGHLFEQFVGLQLMALLQQKFPEAKVKFWLDSNGLEIDWVVEYRKQYLPIEVKWTDHPDKSMSKACEIFIHEYDCPAGGFVICQTPLDIQLSEHVVGISWKNLTDVCEKLSKF